MADGTTVMSNRLVNASANWGIDYGPGYRVYFMQRGSVLVVVLAGGDKRTQRADIQTVWRIAAAGERES